MDKPGAASTIPHQVQNRIALSLLIGFVLLSILSSRDVSATMDERLHMSYGIRILRGNASRLDDSSMPVSILNALPGYLGSFMPPGTLKAVLSGSFVARLVTILFSMLIAYLVFHWSRLLYGFVPALFSIALYILDPNIIAHSQVIATDIYVAGMTTWSFYSLWKFANSRRIRDGLVCALALGLSQLAKYAALALLPLALAGLLIHDWPSVRSSYQRDGMGSVVSYVKSLAAYVAIALIVILLVINAGFLLDRTFTPLKDYRFRSGLFQSVQAGQPWLGQIPVPVPYPYLDGLDWVRHTDETGDRYGYVYLLGHLSKPKGFPGYYFVAALLKVPIATQIILIASLVAFFASKQRRGKFTRDELFLLLPAAFFTIYLNFLFNAQIGIRYYLIMFPLLYVFAGTLFQKWNGFSPARKALSVSLLGYLAVSVLLYFPYYMPYFNEIVWDKTQTYKYLSDSNLYWGQSDGLAAQYAATHPEAVVEPPGVRPGIVIVNADDLVGVLNYPSRYAWLRNNFEPAETIAYSYFVYRISPEQFRGLCATVSDCR